MNQRKLKIRDLTLRGPVCDVTGQVRLDVQFPPDMDIPCPECRGSRYSRETSLIYNQHRSIAGFWAKR